MKILMLGSAFLFAGLALLLTIGLTIVAALYCIGGVFGGLLVGKAITWVVDRLS